MIFNSVSHAAFHVEYRIGASLKSSLLKALMAFQSRELEAD